MDNSTFSCKYLTRYRTEDARLLKFHMYHSKGSKDTELLKFCEHHSTPNLEAPPLQKVKAITLASVELFHP